MGTLSVQVRVPPFSHRTHSHSSFEIVAMSEAADNKEVPAGAKEEGDDVAAATEAVTTKEEEQQEKDGEATTKGQAEIKKMAPPAGGANKNVSGSDAIKAAVKAGNINMHQEERELVLLFSTLLLFSPVASTAGSSSTNVNFASQLSEKSGCLRRTEPLAQLVRYMLYQYRVVHSPRASAAAIHGGRARQR